MWWILADGVATPFVGPIVWRRSYISDVVGDASVSEFPCVYWRVKVLLEQRVPIVAAPGGLPVPTYLILMLFMGIFLFAFVNRYRQ